MSIYRYDYLYSIINVGSSSVGKEDFISKSTGQKYNPIGKIIIYLNNIIRVLY